MDINLIYQVFVIISLCLCQTIAYQERTASACFINPDKILEIDCGEGFMVHIKEEVFGYSEDGRCYHKEDDCSVREDFPVSCTGRSSCSINLPSGEVGKFLSACDQYSSYFQVHYVCVPVQDVLDICTINTTLSSEQGHLRTPDYPLNYNGIHHCKIKLEGHPTQKIKIFAIDFDLSNNQGKCNDNLYVFDQSYGAFTVCQGRANTLLYTSVANQLELTFEAKPGPSKTKGFWLYYEFEDTMKRSKTTSAAPRLPPVATLPPPFDSTDDEPTPHVVGGGNLQSSDDDTMIVIIAAIVLGILLVVLCVLLVILIIKRRQDNSNEALRLSSANSNSTSGSQDGPYKLASSQQRLYSPHHIEAADLSSEANSSIHHFTNEAIAANSVYVGLQNGVTRNGAMHNGSATHNGSLHSHIAPSVRFSPNRDPNIELHNVRNYASVGDVGGGGSTIERNRRLAPLDVRLISDGVSSNGSLRKPSSIDSGRPASRLEKVDETSRPLSRVASNASKAPSIQGSRGDSQEDGRRSAGIPTRVDPNESLMGKIGREAGQRGSVASSQGSCPSISDQSGTVENASKGSTTSQDRRPMPDLIEEDIHNADRDSRKIYF